MITYIYPQNLRATANLWLCGLRDFIKYAVRYFISTQQEFYWR